MRAIVMRSFGGPEVLEARELPLTEPGPGEARVRVGAVVVMRTRDAATRSGRHAFSRFVQPPHVLGGEHAGEVDAVGPGVSPALVGQRVAASGAIACGACRYCQAGCDEACERFELLGIHRPGAYAEHVLVPADNLHAIPDDLPFPAAAVLAATGPVARAQLDAADVRPDGWLAVTGANGMLGSTLVALARQRDLRVIALARSNSDASRLLGLGAWEVLDAERPDLASALLELTRGAGLEAVIDNLALPALWVRCLEALAPRGRVVSSGVLGGESVPLDMRRLYLRSQSIVGLRTGNRAQVAGLWRDVHAGLRIDDGLVRVLPLEDAHEAHTALEREGTREHFVLTPGEWQRRKPRAAAVAHA